MVGAGEVSPRPLQRVQLDSPSGTKGTTLYAELKSKPPQTHGIGTAAICSKRGWKRGEIRNPAQPYEWIWAKSPLAEIVLNSRQSEWE